MAKKREENQSLSDVLHSAEACLAQGDQRVEESWCCNLFRGMSHQANPDSWSRRRRVAVFFVVVFCFIWGYCPFED